MKFEAGDIALLKTSGEEVRIVKYIDSAMVEVEVNNIHFPVFVDELVSPYQKWFAKKQDYDKKPPAGSHPPPEMEVNDLAAGFHFAFAPVFKFDGLEDIVHQFNAYFVNHTSYRIEIQYECRLHSDILFSSKKVIDPFHHFYLHDISFEDMNDQPRFSCILLQEENRQRQAQLSETLRIKPKKLFEHISRLQLSQSAMFHVLIANDFPERLREYDNPSRNKSKRKFRQTDIIDEQPAFERVKPILEIDLHLEKIAPRSGHLSNFEILSLQLEALEKALDQAVRAKQQSMMIIHGVGKGRLKEEVHALLKANGHVDFFQHDWMPGYGYGATEVFFR